MALNEVGTAYVVIKANTEQLAGDIGKGFKQGVADADKDIAASGEESAGSYKKGFIKDIGDGELGDGVAEGIDSPEIHKEAERVGGEVSKDVKKGNQKENKKNNPFKSLEKSLGDTFSNLAKLKLPIIALAAPNVLGGLADILGAALAGVTEGLGFIVQAAAGAGVAIAGIAVTALPALGLIFAALKVNTDELETFKEAAKPLTGQWKNVAVAVQQGLLPGVLDFLEATQVLIPMWVQFGGQIGKIAGNFARMAGKILTSNKNLDAMATILQNSEEFFRLIAEAGLIAFDALIPLFAVLAPLGVDFATSIHTAAENLATFLSQPGKLDELSGKFQDWWDKLKQVGRILADLFVALWNVLGVGAEFGTNMFDSLEKIAQKWRDWTSSIEGTNALRKWFQDNQPLMHEMWLLLKDIAKIVIGPIFDTEGNQGTTDFIKTIRTDWLPVFQGLSDALSGTGFSDALLGLANAFVDLIASFEGSSTIVDIIKGFTAAVDALADVLSSPIAQAIAPVIAEIAAAFFLLKHALPISLIKDLFSLGKGLSGLAEGSAAAGGLEGFGAALAPIAGPLLAVAAAVAAIWAVWHFWDQIVDGLQAAWEWFTKLNTPLKILVGTLAVMTAVILGPLVAVIGVVLGVVAAFKNWDKIAAFVDRVWDAIFKFFTGLPELIGKIPGLLADVFGTVVDFFTELPGKIVNVGAMIGDAILGELAKLPGLMLSALSGLGEIVSTALGAIPGLAIAALSELANIGLSIIGWIADGIVKAAPVVAQFFTELPLKILGWIGEAFSEITGIGINILQWIVEGLVSAVPTLLTFFLKLPFEILTLIRKANVEMIRIGYRIINWMLDGIVAAWPVVLDFFKKLPRRIIDALLAAGTFLLSVGKTIINGLWQGIQAGWDIVLDFFKKLPRRVLDALIGAASWLLEVGSGIIDGMWQGIQTSWDKVLSFFTGLPGVIMGFFTSTIDWLAGVGGDLLQGLFNGALEVWDSINEFFVGIPQKLVDFIEAGSQLLVTLGGKIPGWILDGLTAAAETLWGWFRKLPQALVDIVVGLFDLVVGIGRSMIGWIKDGLVAVADTLWQWFKDLPGEALTALTGVKDDIVGLGESVVGWIIDGLSSLADDIWDAITGALPSISDVANVLKAMWNGAVDLLSFSFEIPVAPHPTISFSGDFLKLAMGGIVPGTALGMPIIAGEHFGAEAIVPMTRPGRALAVMQEAGLDKLVLAAYMGGSVPGQTGGIGGDVTMLHIDTALINEPVNADMIVQKITTAYKRMAS